MLLFFIALVLYLTINEDDTITLNGAYMQE